MQQQIKKNKKNTTKANLENRKIRKSIDNKFSLPFTKYEGKKTFLYTRNACGFYFEAVEAVVSFGTGYNVLQLNNQAVTQQLLL